MFDNWNHWTWVSIAWGQLLLAYGGYLTYLNWRRQKVLQANRGAERATGTPAPAGRR